MAIYTWYIPLSIGFFHVKEIKCIRMVLKMVPEYSILWKHRSSSGWWLSPTPLKNDGVCQLGYVGMMTFPTDMESHKIPWFQTTNQIIYSTIIPYNDGTSQFFMGKSPFLMVSIFIRFHITCLRHCGEQHFGCGFERHST